MMNTKQARGEVDRNRGSESFFNLQNFVVLVPGRGRSGGVRALGVLSASATDVLDDGAVDGVVELLGTSGSGKLEPEDECGLDREVIGEVMEDESEGDALEEREESEDHPVREPLGIILSSRSLESLEGEVGGEEPPDHVGDGESEAVDEDQADEGDRGDKDAISLGNVGLLFDLEEDWVPRELFVELSHILQEPLMRLLDNGVSLDLLGSVVEGSFRVLELRVAILSGGGHLVNR